MAKKNSQLTSLRNKISLGALAVIAISAAGSSLLIRNNQDNRSKAMYVPEYGKRPIKVENYSSTVPAYRLDEYNSYLTKMGKTIEIGKNPISNTTEFVELSVSKNTNCGPKKANCIEIPYGKDTLVRLTSCAKFDFGQVQNSLKSRLHVQYQQTKDSKYNQICVGEKCTASPGLQLYTSSDGKTWNRYVTAASLATTKGYVPMITPESWRTYDKITIDADEKLKSVTLNPELDYRYVTLCRGGRLTDQPSWRIYDIFIQELKDSTNLKTNF